MSATPLFLAAILVTPLLLSAPVLAQGLGDGQGTLGQGIPGLGTPGEGSQRPGAGGTELVPSPGGFGVRPGTAAAREFDRNTGTNFSGAYPLRNDNGFAAEGWRQGGALGGTRRGAATLQGTAPAR